MAIRAEKSFPRAPVCGHVARLFSRKIEGARTPEEEGGGGEGEEWKFFRNGPIDERQTWPG